MDGRRFRRLVSALPALAATARRWGQHQLSDLKAELHPAVGFEWGHSDQLTAGAEDNGGDSNGVYGIGHL